jgi:hypothetical protein
VERRVLNLGAMSNPKLPTLEVALLFAVHGGRASASSTKEITRALDGIKSTLAGLGTDTSSSSDMMPLVMMMAMGRRGGGASGAPAEAGLPPPSQVSAPVAPAPTAQA